MSYQVHSLGAVLPLCRDAVGVFYIPSRLGWDCFVSFSGHPLGGRGLTPLQRCSRCFDSPSRLGLFLKRIFYTWSYWKLIIWKQIYLTCRWSRVSSTTPGQSGHDYKEVLHTFQNWIFSIKCRLVLYSELSLSLRRGYGQQHQLGFFFKEFFFFSFRF